VIAEIALTVVLVSGATLFGRSLAKLLSIDIGFRTANITTAGILMSNGTASEPARAVQAFERVLASVRAMPGVESVGLVSRLPMNAGETWDFEIAGRPHSLPGQAPSGSIRWVAGDYFTTLGIALQRGRLFSDADRADGPRTVIINDALARQYFAGMNPLGQFILRNNDSLRIVGVVRDVPIGRIEDKVPPTWYVPMPQAPQGFMRIAIRTNQPNSNLVRQLSSALTSIDPNAAVVDPAMMADILTRSSSVFLRRFPLLLIGTFAATALVLALVGIYGVVSYSVGQQRRELGIRLALGADARSVIALFLRRSAWMAMLGAATGIGAAALAGRFVSGMLYGVEAGDPVTYTAAALLLGAAALAATFIPALRAARVDPTITLRAE
jgi:predicted permease